MGEPKLKEKAKVVHLNLRPTEQEISEYISKKMGWPKDFSDYYACKFWNFYESKGWMIGKNAMKNWRAAFNGQWQTIKDQRDELKLTQSIRKSMDEDVRRDTIDPSIQYLNTHLLEYFKHPTWIKDETFGFIYDYLKENKMICLDKEECEICKQMGPLKGKSQAVKFLFDKMIKEKKTFI